MLRVLPIILALVGSTAIAAGAATTMTAAPLRFGAVVSAKGQWLQQLAIRSCKCERSGGKGCWTQFDQQRLAGPSYTSCAPVYTISQSHGGEEIITHWNYLAQRGEILLCSPAEANAAERVFHQLAVVDPDGRVSQAAADRAVRDIAAGRIPQRRSDPAGCTSA